MSGPPPPFPTPEAGQAALKALLQERSLLPALQALNLKMGPIFRLSAPGFQPVVLAGPQAAHFVLVEARDRLKWRNETDPVTGLLRQGVLVTDGEQHDLLRKAMSAPLHRQRALASCDVMWGSLDKVCQDWQAGQTLDMLVEMRRAALLILMKALFDVDMSPDLDRLWPDILKTLKYISPGLWLVWEKAPRTGYRRALENIDAYLYGLIASRRAQPAGGEDLLSRLVDSGMENGLVRDQLLTLLIAGHDTSTALLAWTLYLFGLHPDVMGRAQAEVDAVLGSSPPAAENLDELVYLEQVIAETLRLYPPIHVGNRVAAEDLEFGGYTIPAGERVMLSIYATQRDPAHWPQPDRFDPERFAPGCKPLPYTYLPFGGGPRNCIGTAFARVEARAVLARLLQRYNLHLVRNKVRMYMGATLEPSPGVLMKVEPRW